MADLLTWSSDLDNVPDDYSSVALLSKSTMFQLWRALLATGHWVCEGSCDSSAAGMDAVDRLSNSGTFSAALWVRAAAGQAHSWGVLYNAALGLRLCFDLSGGADNYPTVFVAAQAAFTGGSTTARPTSSDEWAYTASSCALNDNTASLFRLHLVYSNRGDFFAWNNKAGSATGDCFALGAFALVIPEGFPTDQYPVVTYCASGSTTSSGVGYTPLFSSNGTWRGRTGGGTACLNADPYLRADAPGYASGSGSSYMAVMPAAGGQWTHKYPEMPIFFSIWSSTYGDFKGTLPDITAAPWSLYRGAPNAVPPTRRAIGALWLPGMSAAGPSY